MLCYNFLWFMFYSFAGWLYESSLYTLLNGKPVNSGFLKGPFCPVYGFGSIIGILLFYENLKSSMAIFLLAFFIEGTFEYLTGTVLEKVFHKKWWDYSELFMNIKGRVCFLSSTVFGILIVLLVKFIHPAVEYFTMLLPFRFIEVLSFLLFVILLKDIIFTVAELTTDYDNAPSVACYKIRERTKKIDNILYKALRTSKTLSNFMDNSEKIRRRLLPGDVSRDYVKLNIQDIYLTLKERVNNSINNRFSK